MNLKGRALDRLGGS